MKTIVAALAMFPILLLAPGPAAGAVNCYPQAAGVAGVIADQKDVIAAVNCLGQQLAELRRAATISDQNQTARVEELARQIAELQGAVEVLSRRVSALEGRLNDVLTPLATRPW
ncbi:hypothetical protein [Methylocystis sp. ATCC 49242]|uniref:hypothetical protein n=1 Tax=Methylocystis sp. ATCC 49242 TaxID=622637 RepID=UPI0001F8800C|nr:hypothetical protein [Methylocystis sp. ATCC 49242]